MAQTYHPWTAARSNPPASPFSSAATDLLGFSSRVILPNLTNTRPTCFPCVREIHQIVNNGLFFEGIAARSQAKHHRYEESVGCHTLDAYRQKCRQGGRFMAITATIVTLQRI